MKRRGSKAPTEAQALRTRIEPPIGSETTSTARLGDLLVRRQLISPAELAGALAQQGASGHRLGAELMSRGVLDERALNEALSAHFGIPSIDLRRYEPSPGALALVPETRARDLQIVPISLEQGALSVALGDPLDERVAEYLSLMPVSLVRVFVASPTDIEDALNSSYRALAEVHDQIRQFEATSLAPPVAQTRVGPELGDAPVVAVVNQIVTQALRDRASDVHIEPTDTSIRVRYRIDGALNEVLSLPSAMGAALVSRLKIMADMNIVERRRPQDGQFQMTIDGRELDVRVATTATIWGEKAVLRLLDKSRALLRLDDLGMPPDTHKLYSNIVHKPYGMVICTGPTGSGKTTTLYATLMEITRSEVNVMTIEDPVEYVFPQVNQIQINPQAGITFASGLRSILRQDPDIILVGEVRDAETARIAVQSALTGHVVMSSLHATDSASALYRLLDMGVEPFLVSSSVVGVVAQRLVRRICPSCATPEPLPVAEQQWYDHLGGPAKEKFLRGAGCAYCSGTGYRGRIGVYEVLEVTDEIRHLLASQATPREVRELATQQGMHSLADAAVRLVADDVTTIDEIIRNVYVP